jgi:tetratricopeptide (TPR) repeat protein
MSRRAAASTTKDEDDGRRWHIPPPVLGLTGFTGPEGAVILEEVEGPLGVLLWRTFRNVATWSATPAAARAQLAVDGDASVLEAINDAVPPAELAGPLNVLAAIRTATQPKEAAVGSAVQAVGRWATSAGHGRAGAELHQLAASVCPSDPDAALLAGRATRRIADYSRSEIWLQRAIDLARRAEDWRTYADGFLELGTMMRRRGNLPAARRHFKRAYRRALRAGLHDLRAQAAHDLFVTYTELSRREDAEHWALEALRTYPRGDANIPRVAFDLAFLWLADGQHEEALRVFTTVEPLVSGAGNAVVWGGIGRAAGGCGDRERFERARAELLRASPSAGLSDAWLELARGARLLQHVDHAVEAATTSLEMARSRGEHKVEIQAEEFLSQLNMATPAEKPPLEPPAGSRWDPSIAEEVIHVLQAA